MKKLQRNKQSGMTLIEITLVIAILLSLIAVLFLGVSAYKKGADRAKCILNITTMQKTMRSYANLNEKDELDACTTADLAGPGLMLAVVPTCPDAAGAYTFLAIIPPASVSAATLYTTCSLAGAATPHVPKNPIGW